MKFKDLKEGEWFALHQAPKTWIVKRKEHGFNARTMDGTAMIFTPNHEIEPVALWKFLNDDSFGPNSKSSQDSPVP